MPSPKAFHTDSTDDYGTPPAYCELSRYTLGAIDLDPSSSAYWNHWHVKAAKFYSAEDDFTKQPIGGRVHWNPPSGKGPDKKTSLPRLAWRMLVDAWRRGECKGAVWMGYSLEQLTLLQGEPIHPLQFMTLFPCERIPFYTRVLLCRTCGQIVTIDAKSKRLEHTATDVTCFGSDAYQSSGPPIESKSPSHGNYITLLQTQHSASEAKAQMQRFVERARMLDVGGAIVRPL
jgi:hypothetical protein